MRAAVVQLHSTTDKSANLRAAAHWLGVAADQGARLAVLPELFNALGPAADIARQAEDIPGPTSQWLADQARAHGLWIVGGSIAERVPGDTRYGNTSLLVGPDGRLLARYRKRHLFDIQLAGQVCYAESRWVQPGTELAVTDTPAGPLGQAICYDLRFPELFRTLVAQGMEVLALPSAFTQATGRDHWHVLVRARAIENQVYVLAANQSGVHSADLTTFGHSLIVDPWGQVLAELPEKPGMICADLSPERLRSIRQQLPALLHRRPTP